MLTYGALLPARPQYLEQIPDIERAGFRDVWFPDFQLAGADPFVTIAVQAARSEALDFGVGVCNPVTRHVTVVANLMATLNREFPGRVGLGIGVGASPLKALGLPPARLADLEQFVIACRALMNGHEAAVSADGSPVRFLDFWRGAMETDAHVPIRLAAGGPRSLRLAGAIADEVIIGTIDPALLRLQLTHVHAGAESAGRDPSLIGVAVLAAAYVAEDEPRLETLQQRIGGYVPNMLVSNGGCVPGNEDSLDPVLVRAFAEFPAAQARAIESAQQAGGGRRSAVFESYMESYPAAYEDLVNTTTLRAKAFFGSVAQVDARLEELAELGVTKVVLYPDARDPTALENFARRHITVRTRGQTK